MNVEAVKYCVFGVGSFGLPLHKQTQILGTFTTVVKIVGINLVE